MIDVTPTRPPGFESLDTLFGWLMWGGLAAAIAALIGIGVLMMVSQTSNRTDNSEWAGKVTTVFVAVMIIGAASALIGFFA